MIGHPAIRPNFDPAFTAPFGHQCQKGRIVLITTKRLLPPIPTLRDMMRQARHD